MCARDCPRDAMCVAGGVRDTTDAQWAQPTCIDIDFDITFSQRSSLITVYAAVSQTCLMACVATVLSRCLYIHISAFKRLSAWVALSVGWCTSGTYWSVTIYWWH